MKGEPTTNATTTEPAAPAATEGAPPPAATPADPKAAAAAPDQAKPAEGAQDEPSKSDAPGPDTAKLAAEVMRQRDAKQLGALVREKKQLEATAAKHKEREADLAAFDRFSQLYEDDPASALEYMLAHKAGDPEKARVALARAYDGLTSRILNVDSKAAAVPAKVERSVSRLEKDFEALKQEKAQTEAKLRAREEADEQSRIDAAKATVGTWLNSDDSMKTYPYLLAEADDPAEIVWGVVAKAEEDGINLTFGQAAELMNDHFKPIAEKKATRYTSLLAPTKGSDTPSKPETSKSQTSTSRKSLTNADASKTTSNEPAAKPKSDAERLELSWQKLREGHRT